MSSRRLRAGLALTAVTLVGAVAAAPAALASIPPMSAQPAPQVMRLARVDRSAWPTVGLVLTLPGIADARTASAGLSLRSDQFTAPASTAAALAASDLEVVIVPQPGLGGEAMRAQRRELATLAHELPGGAKVAVLDDSARADALPEVPTLSADSTPAVARLAALPTRPGTRTPAQLVDAALNVFTSGARVRRTVFLVTDAHQVDDPLTLARVQARLQASGTQLFVIELGAPTTVATLVPATGGFTIGGAAPQQVLLAGTGQLLSDLTHQYYVQFQVPATAPSSSALTVDYRSGATHSTIDVPQPAASIAPPPPPAPAPATDSQPSDLPLTLLAISLVATSLLYGLGMLVASRRPPRPWSPDDVASVDGLHVTFVIPCLNEARVIAAGIDRLLALDRADIRIVVIDDGSDDDTAAVVEQFDDPRVRLLRRRLPDARKGKGEALNAVYRLLLEETRLLGRDPKNVILAVVDADGRLDPRVLADITPYFADPRLAGVQIGVRINNRHDSRLARMQDMEFVLFTEVFQRGRRHLGSTGLGGNGQFMRMSALADLGDSPWSRSLTEDLDLGVRLIARGWRTDFCPTADVHQQGVVTWRTLLRQRTRWFQGHLQAWPLIPEVLAGAPRRARADLVYHLSSPVLLLIASLLSASFLASLVADVGQAAMGRNPLSWWFLSTYLLTVGPAVAFTTVYRRKETPTLSWVRTVGLAHAYVGYSLMWYVAGWRAMGRVVLHRSGWAKTARLAEPAPTTENVVPAADAVPELVTVRAPVVIDLTDAALDVPTLIINLRSLPQSPPTAAGRR